MEQISVMKKNIYNNRENFNQDIGYIVDYSLGKNIDIDYIIPRSKYGKVELFQLTTPLVKESDKDSIMELLNYTLNGSGFIYLLSLQYESFDELNTVLSNIVLDFFKVLYKMNRNQLVTYVFTYKHINPYFAQLKNKLVF